MITFRDFVKSEYRKCLPCKGSGKINGETCPGCQGNGKYLGPIEVSAVLGPGFENGQSEFDPALAHLLSR